MLIDSTYIKVSSAARLGGIDVGPKKGGIYDMTVENPGLGNMNYEHLRLLIAYVRAENGLRSSYVMLCIGILCALLGAVNMITFALGIVLLIIGAITGKLDLDTLKNIKKRLLETDFEPYNLGSGFIQSWY